MPDTNQMFTKDKFIKNELPIKACSLLAEIKPLLEDYFVGEISLDDRGITYILPNGQRFILSAVEA